LVVRGPGRAADARSASQLPTPGGPATTINPDIAMRFLRAGIELGKKSPTRRGSAYCQIVDGR
jgi:hypothetical protein